MHDNRQTRQIEETRNPALRRTEKNHHVELTVCTWRSCSSLTWEGNPREKTDEFNFQRLCSLNFTFFWLCLKWMRRKLHCWAHLFSVFFFFAFFLFPTNFCSPFGHPHLLRTIQHCESAVGRMFLHAERSKGTTTPESSPQRRTFCLWGDQNKRLALKKFGLEVRDELYLFILHDSVSHEHALSVPLARKWLPVLERQKKESWMNSEENHILVEITFAWERKRVWIQHALNKSALFSHFKCSFSPRIAHVTWVCQESR